MTSTGKNPCVVELPFFTLLSFFYFWEKQRYQNDFSTTCSLKKTKRKANADGLRNEGGSGVTGDYDKPRMLCHPRLMV